MALQLIFLESDDSPDHGIILQEGTDREVRVKGLKDADDIATISPTVEQTSERITAIAETSFNRGTLEAHTIKSEHMPLMQQGVFDGGTVSEKDIVDAKLPHKCEHCDRSFSSHHGLAIHVARWCGEATREHFPTDYEAEKIIDARGSPENRFYKVQWAGTNLSDNTVLSTEPPN